MKKFRYMLTVLVFWPFLMGSSPVAKQWIPEWQETQKLPSPRAGTAVIASGGYLYVIGGVNGNHFLRDTIYANIGKDGSLGPWQNGPALNELRGHFDAVLYKGRIYVVGGASGPNGSILSRTVEHAGIRKDGSLTPWVLEKNALNMPRRCSKAVFLGDTFFTLGGYGGDLLNTVEHADFDKEGGTTEWFEEEEKLTVVRYISGVKAVGNAVYVVGGHHPLEGKGIADVEWSKVKDTAGFNPWQNATPLNTGRYGLALVQHDGNLYALGGVNGNFFMTSTEKSRIDGEGKLSPWEYTTPLRTRRGSFSAVVYKNFIYVIGGADEERFIDSIEYASFNDKGDIGHYATGAEATAYLEKVKAEEAEIAEQYPNSGIVTEVLYAESYTYLAVKENDAMTWLSAPKIEVNVGATIRYENGLSMANFWSKDLRRTFPVLLMLTSPVKVVKQ